MAGYENLTLEKGMYMVPGKSFTEVLEDLDSSENYRGTSLEGMDAFERQLMRFGIRVSGESSGNVESFFLNSSSAALFPEYVARAVRQGIDREQRVREIVAAVTLIDGLDYRTVSPEEITSPALPLVGEGAELPVTAIRTGKGLVTLHKRGRLLTSSYEAMRFMKLDLLSVTLRQIGAHIAIAQLNDAVNALIDGDGVKPGITFTTATPAYSDFIAAWGSLAPYRLTSILAGTEAMQKILNIAEFKDSQAGMNFHATGNAITPLGAKLIHVPGMQKDKIVLLDRDCALEMVAAGGVVTESDKLIDRELNRAAVSFTAGFARIFENAALGLNCSA